MTVPNFSAASHCRASTDGAAKGKATASPAVSNDHAWDVPLSLDSWRRLVAGRNWQEALCEGLSDKQLAEMRRFTMTGRPLGGDSFLSKIETALGRRLRAMPVGRPKKNPTTKRGGNR